MAKDNGPVALFAGGTAGLGEAILKAYAKNHVNARIYFVGRNEVAAQEIIKDVRQIWKDISKDAEGQGDIIFLKVDLSLLKNVRSVAEEFGKREGENARLDFLCMSQGFLTMRGRMGRCFSYYVFYRFPSGVGLVFIINNRTSHLSGEVSKPRYFFEEIEHRNLPGKNRSLDCSLGEIASRLNIS